MKRLLLSALACVAGITCLASVNSTATVNETAFVNNLTRKQMSMADKIANPYQIVSSPSMKRNTLKAGSSEESIKLTVNWDVSTESDLRDRIILFLIIDENKNYYSLGADEILEYQGQSFDLDIPKGKYYGVMVFTTKTPECDALMKLVLMDETDLSEDTALTFDGKTAIHRISQKYILPNGEPADLVDYTGDGTYEGGNCGNGTALCMLRILEIPDISWRISNFLESDTPGEFGWGSCRIMCNDFFVNRASNKFDVYTTMQLQPIDIENQKPSSDIPAVITSKAIPITGTDMTYTQTIGDLVKFIPPVFDRSMAEGTPFPDIFLEYHMRNMCLNGTWTDSTIFPSYLPDGSIMTDLDDNAPVLFDMSTNEDNYWDSTGVFSFLGIVSPKFLIKEDGQTDYIMFDNIYTRMMYDDIIRVNYITPDMLQGHPFYSFNSNDNIPEFGNSAPILSFPICQSHPDEGTAFLFPNDISNPTWVGNFGERRSIDKYNMTFTVKAGDETILDNWSEFPWPIFDHAMEQHEAHEISMIFDNSNFEIAGLQGRSYAEIKYLEKAEGDINSPSVQMMQFRDGDNRISNRFDNSDVATINISYGDFYYQYDLGDRRFLVSDCDIKVETAPYGTEDYIEIATEQNPELFMMPCWGYFRSGKLTGLGTSSNGWWNIRLTLKDDSGNSNVQTISPAFYAANTDPSGIKDITMAEDGINAVYYNLQGVRIDNPSSGIYIKVSDGKSRKVVVK